MCKYSSNCPRTGVECEGCECFPSAEMILAGGIQGLSEEETQELFEEILENEGLSPTLPNEAIKNKGAIKRLNLPIYQ